MSFSNCFDPHQLYRNIIRDLDRKIQKIANLSDDTLAKDITGREYADIILQSSYMDIMIIGCTEPRRDIMKRYQSLWKETLSRSFPKGVRAVDAVATVRNTYQSWYNDKVAEMSQKRDAAVAKRKKVEPVTVTLFGVFFFLWGTSFYYLASSRQLLAAVTVPT